MNGAELLIKTAARSGIEVCFANAGTTEMPIVVALDSVPGVKAILGLFEGVCTGAADGYGRMLDRPALTLLHLGPGFANGIANLHNARKARTPVVNIIGEHATWHRDTGAPLAMNIEMLAGAVSGWYKTSESTAALSQDISNAISASRYGQISTLIVPSDNQWTECDDTIITKPEFEFDPVDSDSIEKAARLLRKYDKTAMILEGRALRKRGLQAAARIKAATECDLITQRPAYMDRGVGLPDIARIPYFPEPAVEMLSKYEAVVLVSTGQPVTFFGYKGLSSYLLNEEQARVEIGNGRQNAAEVLEHLADELNASVNINNSAGVLADYSRPGIPDREFNPKNICLTLAALQPENAIIIDEGITTSTTHYPLTAGLPEHTFITIVGGSIGYGLPCAVGASIACPERPVVDFQADGSAMYTLQALWTAARNGLNVTTLICSNKSYKILKVELSRAGVTSFGSQVSALVDLDRPDINWVKLAEGMGVPGVSVDSIGGLAKEFSNAQAEAGPHLIEMLIS
ncbi:acetolactate synthase large subunit [Chloroflexota bacterium]